jgi:hypothetical protein
MKFNQAKWEAMQHRKAALHEIYQMADSDFQHENDNLGKKLSVFGTNYRDYPNVQRAVQEDCRRLSTAEVRSKLDRLRSAWPKVCEEFNVSSGFEGKNTLIEIYTALLSQRKARDVKDTAGQNQQAFGACFNVLQDFATKHGQYSGHSITAVPDQMPGGF